MVSPDAVRGCRHRGAGLRAQRRRPPAPCRPQSTVGLVVLDVRNPFFTDLARGAEHELAKHGSRTDPGQQRRGREREAELLDLFEEQRVRGILISPYREVGPQLRRASARHPRVLVDRLASTKSYTSVAVDDVMGGTLALDHLLDVGRRKLAFVGGPMTIEQVRNRLAGARAAIAERGAGTLDVYELGAMNTASARPVAELIAASGGQATRRRLRGQRPDRPRAAAGVRDGGPHSPWRYRDRRVRRHRVRRVCNRPLSSIRQPSHQMGRRAAQMLLAEIDDPESATAEHIVFEPELVIRASTAGVAAPTE